MRTVLALIASLTLAACAAPAVQDYAAQRPKFDFKTYFNGKVDGWGMVQDRSGKVTKRMYVEMTGTWAGDVGTLDERFSYADGTRETRSARRPETRFAGAMCSRPNATAAVP